MMRRRPTYTLFPYTTLFRSQSGVELSAPHQAQEFAAGTRIPPEITQHRRGDFREDSRTRSEFLRDRKSTRLNSIHGYISYAVFCLKKKKTLSIRTNHLNITT